MGYFLDTQLVGTPSQIEEAKVGEEPPLHGQIAGHGGIEATGNQRQHTVLGTEGETTQSRTGILDQKYVLAAYLNGDDNIRIAHFYPGGITGHEQAGAHMALHIHGAELVGAATPHPHTKGLARQTLLPAGHCQVADIIQGCQRVIVHS